MSDSCQHCINNKDGVVNIVACRQCVCSVVESAAFKYLIERNKTLRTSLSIMEMQCEGLEAFNMQLTDEIKKLKILLEKEDTFEVLAALKRHFDGTAQELAKLSKTLY